MSKATITYNQTDISEESGLTSPVSITYNGQTIASVADGESKELQCNGKVMLSDVVVGGKTLKCGGKLMASDVKIGVESEQQSLAGQTWKITGFSMGPRVGKFVVNCDIISSAGSATVSRFSGFALGYVIYQETGQLRGSLTGTVYFANDSFTLWDGTASQFMYDSVYADKYGANWVLGSSDRWVQISFIDGQDIANATLMTWLSTYATRII